MVTAELAQRFARAGVQLVSPPAGRKALVDELRQGGPAEAEVIWGGPIRPEPVPAPAPAGEPSQDYPLLSDRNKVWRKTNGSLEVLLETSPDEHIYLLDHQLDGTAVMPMAMILELAAEVAAANWPDMHVTRIRNLQILNGIKYQNGSRRVLRVEASMLPTRAGEPVLFEMAVSSEAGGARPHYRAQVELRRELAAPPDAPRLELVEPRRLGLTVEQAYENWLFHGPLFAGITQVEALGANGITGRLRSSSPRNFFQSSPSGAWLVDPAMLDSGMQLVLLWVRTYLDQTPLPSHVGCYHRFAVRAPAEVRCEADVRGDPASPTMVSDVRFRDEDGRLIAWLQDVQFTRSRALNRLGGIAKMPERAHAAQR
jgi:hypothetical protein